MANAVTTVVTSGLGMLPARCSWETDRRSLRIVAKVPLWPSWCLLDLRHGPFSLQVCPIDNWADYIYRIYLRYLIVDCMLWSA